MSFATEISYYVIFQKGRYYKSVKAARFSKREPKLKDGEVAVKVNMTVPYEIFTPTVSNLTISENQIIRPPVDSSAS